MLHAVPAGALVAADNEVFHESTALHPFASSIHLGAHVNAAKHPAQVLCKDEHRCRWAAGACGARVRNFPSYPVPYLPGTDGLQVHAVLAGGGVDADDGDFHGRTALHLAASNGHLATARRLVLGEADADCWQTKVTAWVWKA